MSQEPTFNLSAFQQLYLNEATQGVALLRQRLEELEQYYNTNTEKDSQIITPLSISETLTEAHRIAHMLKGMSAAMHYNALAGLAFEMESWLYQAKQANRQLDPNILQEIESHCNKFQTGLMRLAKETNDAQTGP